MTDPLAAIAADFAEVPDVAMSRMFGTIGLGVRGKVFVFVGFEGDVILKLPEARVDELAASGVAEHKVMRGRPMREWASVSNGDLALSRELAHEAYAFVDVITPGGMNPGVAR